MARACFYVLNANTEAHLPRLISQLIAPLVKQRRKIVVLAAQQEQAEAIDEALWQFPVQQFIPHNLYGEGPVAGTPVLIGWQQPLAELTQQRNVIINLQASAPELARQTQFIIDIVPADEAGKEQARERYRHYRNLGIQLDTQPAPELNEGHYG